ncbi:MAG: hypothetical protein NDJ90_00620 [Oligoflexia bacterium]|nr:hypothetical protein [Oligoflexia bacterium]
MRWNCPHCGISLAVSDDKLGAGWSFSRCYKCGGFALIRRAEVNLVKVDRAPAGEHIILPEGTEDPVSMLSEDAAQNLARLRQNAQQRPVIRPATTTQNPAHSPNLAMPNLAMPNLAMPNLAMPPLPPQMTAPHLPLPGSQQAVPPLPSPLPELPVTPARSVRAKTLSVAISLAAVATIASGIYLYLQGRALWDRATSVAANAIAPAESNIRPASSRLSEVVAAPSLASEMSDQVRHNAMAPMREPAAGDPAAAPSQKQGEAPTQSANDALPSLLVVQSKGKSVDMHSGPGSLYPTIGYAEPGQRLIVADWNDRWFKVIADSKTAWVRTDLVQVVPAKTEERLPNYP